MDTSLPMLMLAMILLIAFFCTSLSVELISSRHSATSPLLCDVKNLASPPDIWTSRGRRVRPSSRRRGSECRGPRPRRGEA